MDPQNQNHQQEHDEMNRSIISDVSENMRRMRDFRRQYDSRRSYFYRQYVGQRDGMKYADNVTPRSNTFIPYPYSNVETVVSRVLDSFFGTSDFMECHGRGEGDDNAAEKMEAVITYQIHRANLKAAIESLTRTICIYGHGGIKVDWDWDFDTVTYKQPIPVMMPGMMDEQGNQGPPQPMIDPQSGQPVIAGYKSAQKQIPRSRPKFIPVDVYDLLVDPDGLAVAHLTERTLGQLKREAAAYAATHEGDPPLYYPEALQKLEEKITSGDTTGDANSVIIRMAEYWDIPGQTCTILTFSADAKEAISWKDLRAAYRSTSYSTYKRKLYNGEDILLWHGENYFAHKRSPLLYTSYVKLPNETYGVGVIEPISGLVEALNKMTNMVSDNWNLGINHRFAYDSSADIDHNALNNANVPGGKVAVAGDPSKAIMPLPSFTPNQGDYMLLDVYRTTIEMASGVSDFYSKGVGSSGGNKTATGINQIVGESNNKFRMFIDNLEVDIFQPMLEMIASMNQQFITDEYEFQITHDQPAIAKYQTVSPEELLGQFTFDLVAANYAVGRVVTQRNLMALGASLEQSPFVDQYILQKEICKAFQLPKNIMKPLQQIQMEQQQAQMQQQAQLNDERAFQTKMALLQHSIKTESAARKSQSKPVPGKEGRPATMQFEGKIPGAGLTSTIRDLAQNMSGGSMGLEGTEGEGQ